MLTNCNNDLLQDHQNRWISLERKRLDQRIETGRTRIAGCHSRWSHIPPLSHLCVQLVSSRLAFPRLLFLDNQLHSTCLPEDTPVSPRRALAILGRTSQRDLYCEQKCCCSSFFLSLSLPLKGLYLLTLKRLPGKKLVSNFFLVFSEILY